MCFQSGLASPSVQIDSALMDCTTTSEPRDEICAICRDKVKDSRSVSCGHVFCQMCIRSHLARFNDCPLCRKRLFSANTATPSAQIEHAMKKTPAGIIPGEHLCAVCQEIIYEAMTITCGHFFCRMCIRTHLATFDDCPTCQKTLFSFTSLLTGSLTSKVRATWESFLWSIYCPILVTIVTMLSVFFVIYMMYTEWILGAGLAAYGFLMLVVHLTIGFDKFEKYCKMLPDPRLFVLKIQRVLMWILFMLSTLIAVCELLSFVLSAMLIILKSPAFGTVMEGQIRLMASLHFLDWLVYQCFILIYFYFEPRLIVAVLAAQAEAAPSSAQAMATVAQRRQWFKQRRVRW